MMANQGSLESFRQIVAQEASIPALRVTLFALGALAALAWARRRPTLALATVSIGGLLGLAYWLIQIVSPLGFETDPSAAADWAQAGVDAGAEPKGAGFVQGTDTSSSLVSTFAAAGLPFHFVTAIPQLASLLTLGLLILLPFAFLRDPTTAAFAASLALGGGLWPGIAPYGSVLLRPSSLLVASFIFAMLLAAGRVRTVRAAFHRSRFLVSGTLVAASALLGVLGRGGEPGVTTALLASVATVALASPLRAALRRGSSSSGSARTAEALVLLCVFAGSGLLWWNPPGGVAGFNHAREENAALLRPMEWIKKNVPRDSVVLASPGYSASIAAFAGRRVLFRPSADAQGQMSLPEPFRRARLWESTILGRPLARLAAGFSVTHLFLGPGEATPPASDGTSADGDEPRLVLVPVYQDAKDFRVFRLAKK